MQLDKLIKTRTLWNKKTITVRYKIIGIEIVSREDDRKTLLLLLKNA